MYVSNLGKKLERRLDDECDELDELEEEELEDEAGMQTIFVVVVHSETTISH
jgi:hypothetical protein